jgi:hypothetical protein
MADSAEHAISVMQAVEQKERRGAPRFTLALPIVVHRIPLRREGDLLYGKTRDISTTGLYFTTYEPVEPGNRFELSFTLPLEATDGTQILITLQASAVRIVTQPETVFERVGVGAVIEKFQILQTDRESPN